MNSISSSWIGLLVFSVYRKTPCSERNGVNYNDMKNSEYIISKHEDQNNKKYQNKNKKKTNLIFRRKNDGNDDQSQI